jgi:hypothetical protein
MAPQRSHSILFLTLSGQGRPVPSRHSAPSHHNLSSVDFITNIAESNFRYTQSKSSKAKKKAPRQRG